MRPFQVRFHHIPVITDVICERFHFRHVTRQVLWSLYFGTEPNYLEGLERIIIIFSTAKITVFAIV